MHAQDAVGLFVRDDLDEAGRLAHGHGTAHGGKREAADLVRDALVLALGFGLADPGQLGLGVDHPRHGIQIDMAGQARNEFGHSDAFFGCLVGQHGSTHAIADRPDAVHTGVAVFVDLDLAALAEFDRDTFGQQVACCRTTADGHQQLVHHQGLLPLGIRVCQVHTVCLDLGLAQLRAQFDVQTLFFELACGDFADVSIHGRQERRQCLENRDFGAETVPHTAQFQADHASADHAQARGHLVEVQATHVVDNAVTIELRERQFDGVRTGRENHVDGLQLDLAAVVLLDLDQVARVQGAEAVERGHLVGLEQHRDAAGELADDLVLATDHDAHVDRRLLGRDAVVGESVQQVMELARAVQQRLGRDAAHPQAGAAERRLVVLAQSCIDAGDFQAQLRGADRRDVSAGAAADHDDIEVLWFAHLKRILRLGAKSPGRSARGSGWE